MNIEKATLNAIKAAISGIVGTIANWLGNLAYPVYMLVLLGILDYFTGITAAKYRGQKRSSLIGLRGIVKKLCLLLLVFLGQVMDWLVDYAAATVGLDYQAKFVVAAMVAVWLICNEIISILENIGDIGAALPPILTKMVRWVQCETELSGDCKEQKKREPGPEQDTNRDPQPKQDETQEETQEETNE